MAQNLEHTTQDFTLKLARYISDDSWEDIAGEELDDAAIYDGLSDQFRLMALDEDD